MPRKRRAGKGYQHRRIDVREPQQRFLIVCEGKKTEPAYFKQFRGPNRIIEVKGLGKDPLTLVKEACIRRDKEKYDQVWCVFDRDEVLPERFNHAFEEAQQCEVKVAYSNQAFELWFLLHFHYCDTAMSRSDYVERMSQHLGRPYQKSDATLFDALYPRLMEAINNAARLMGKYDPSRPAEDDPSTTVHLLVQELIQSELSLTKF